MDDNDLNFDGRRIIIGITGGIACYKVADLVSKLVQTGSTIDVVMTEAATHFVTPLTFASLTGRAVLDSQWSFVDGHDPQHIRLAKSCSAMLIAPCTMDMVAKLAIGLTNDTVSLVASAIDRSSTPLLVAPSMNVTMFNQPSTQRNLQQLSDDGYKVLDVQDGWQACRSFGQGRLPETEVLLKALSAALSQKNYISS